MPEKKDNPKYRDVGVWVLLFVLIAFALLVPVQALISDDFESWGVAEGLSVATGMTLFAGIRMKSSVLSVIGLVGIITTIWAWMLLIGHM